MIVHRQKTSSQNLHFDSVLFLADKGLNFQLSLSKTVFNFCTIQ